ncbi:MAG: hypothetical protein E7447_01370 [Ruminococcaceae bacterium]|nr:hypothetical protein [Oscillospiraceae bacterium]
MDREELWRRLMLSAEQNVEYQKALQELKTVEEDYTALLESLSAEQREVLERYISACEEMDEALVFAAYQIGLSGNLH